MKLIWLSVGTFALLLMGKEFGEYYGNDYEAVTLIGHTLIPFLAIFMASMFNEIYQLLAQQHAMDEDD